MLYVCVQMTEHLAFESQSQNLTFALDNLLTEISYFYHRTTQNEGEKWIVKYDELLATGHLYKNLLNLIRFCQTFRTRNECFREIVQKRYSFLIHEKKVGQTLFFVFL